MPKKTPTRAQIDERIRITHEIEEPLKRIRRFGKLARSAGDTHAEPYIIAMMDEIGKADPVLVDPVRSEIVDVLIAVRNFSLALTVASKMADPFDRAACYAEVRHNAQLNSDERCEQMADHGFKTAYEQIDAEDRPKLNRLVELIKEDD